MGGLSLQLPLCLFTSDNFLHHSHYIRSIHYFIFTECFCHDSSSSCYIPSVARQIYSDNLMIDPYHVSYTSQYLFSFIIAVFAIWNLDFFGSSMYLFASILTFKQSACRLAGVYHWCLPTVSHTLNIHPCQTTCVVVWLWKPLHRLLASFRRQWNNQSYLVHTLATFIVLSYAKILNTSFSESLFSSCVFNLKGQSANKWLWYYNGSVDMTSMDQLYLPYLLLATFMLVAFSILPLLLPSLQLSLKMFQISQQPFTSEVIGLHFKYSLIHFTAVLRTLHMIISPPFATLYMAVRLIF